MRQLLFVLLCFVIICGGCGHLSLSPSSASTPLIKAKNTEPVTKPTCSPLSTRPIDDADNDAVADMCDECPKTPENVAVDSFGCPIPLFVRHSMQFASNQDAFSPEFHNTMQRLGTLLAKNPTTVIRLEGHSDSLGDEKANLELSQRRAESVKQVLTTLYAIPESRIMVTAYGESRPLVSNNTEEGRLRNRRVTMTVSGFYQSQVTHLALNKPVLLHFASARTTLERQERDTVEQLGRYLQTHPAAWAAIEGHTDSVGDAGINLSLSKQRAEFVRNILINEFSLDPRRLVAVGYGEERPMANNDTEEGRLKNRRVEIRLQKGGLAQARVLRESLADAEFPGQRYTIEVSVKECKLRLYENQDSGERKLIRTFTVATAKPGVRSPFGKGHVTKIDLNPWWHPTPGMKAAARRKGRSLAAVRPGSPRNPMGSFKIYLSHHSTIRIHGTNKPEQLGKRVSAGCIRMRNEEGKMLANLIDVGTEVVIRN